MMNYKEVLDFMYKSLPMYQRIGKAAYKDNLDNTHKLDDHFESPHKFYKTIHVAGTNGKGSVSHIIASVLQEAGYKTGLYTSPHLLDYRERIKINGQMIPERFVCDLINNAFEIINEIKPSFFEMSVALAFEYFKQEKVDVAVIEVGMGGRLDSTNIISPELSVITNIGLDHTQFLGDSIEKIAAEKAGIIKEQIPVVIGESSPDSRKVFLKTAAEKKSRIKFADDDVAINNNGESCKITSKINDFEFRPDLKGTYQIRNYSTALFAIETLTRSFSGLNSPTIKKGFENVIKNTGIRGRWEVVSKKPLVICDTGHNRDGLTYVIKQLASIKHKNTHFVLGFVNDKNIAHLLKLFPEGGQYYFTKADIPRALNPSDLQQEAKIAGIKGEAFDSVAAAYKSALQNADSEDIIFIGGSTFVVAEFLGILD